MKTNHISPQAMRTIHLIQIGGAIIAEAFAIRHALFLVAELALKTNPNLN